VRTNQAFEVLGIPPTEDGRAVRAAFLRLAKIYHPDRFVEMPSDVRDEAERRMKEATTAYELIRNRKTEGPAIEQIDDDEIHRRAAKYREAIETKKLAEEKDRARWRRWDQVERIARDNAKREADIAARIADEVGVARSEPKTEAPATPLKAASNGAAQNGAAQNGASKNTTTRDPLAERLDAARRGVKDPLVKRG